MRAVPDNSEDFLHLPPGITARTAVTGAGQIRPEIFAWVLRAAGSDVQEVKFIETLHG